MAIVFTREKKTWEWTGQSGERIWGEKPSSHERNELLNRYARRARADQINTFNVMLLASSIRGWQGFVFLDEEKKEKEYTYPTGTPGEISKERVRFVVSLQEEAPSAFTECVMILGEPTYSEDLTGADASPLR